MAAHKGGRGAKGKGKQAAADTASAAGAAGGGGDEDEEEEEEKEGGERAVKRQKTGSEASAPANGQRGEEEGEEDDMIGIDCEMCQSAAGPEEAAGKVAGGAGAGGHAVTTAELMRICVVNRKGEV